MVESSGMTIILGEAMRLARFAIPHQTHSNIDTFPFVSKKYFVSRQVEICTEQWQNKQATQGINLTSWWIDSSDGRRMQLDWGCN